MVAYLTRVFGPEHLDLADEVVQDALVKALQRWPFQGVPENPGGWLLAVARNGALDALRRNVSRRNVSLRDKEVQIAATLAAGREASDRDEPAFERELRDDELPLIFLCCHPALGQDARVALSLKAAGAFGVREIARAFLADEATVVQRIVRAKRQLRAAAVPFELPRGADLAGRLDSVLEVLYLLFNEGYAAHEGESLIRLDLCREALRLARLVADVPATAAPRANALVTLMAFQAARLRARVNESGELVLLEDQDRSLWDRRLLALGFRHLDRSARGDTLSGYHVQAAIAAVHASSADAESTDWAEILDLYDQLLELAAVSDRGPQPAVALARVRGAMAGLAELDELDDEAVLCRYYLLPAVRASLWMELGASRRRRGLLSGGAGASVHRARAAVPGAEGAGVRSVMVATVLRRPTRATSARPSKIPWSSQPGSCPATRTRGLATA